MSERFDSSDADAQDNAEAFDEDATSGDGELRTFEELPEVEDLTQADGDRDEDEALALDADEFDPESIGDADLEEDHELDYRAADEEHEDDLDGLGPESPNFDAAAPSPGDIDGLGDELRDASEAEGGEDDFTDFEAKGLNDEDLEDLGYGDGAKAKPNG